VNPFLVPRTGPRSRQPLCPWRVPEHESYYVPVDGTESGFQEFGDALSDYESVERAGRLVLVYGESGCGKTSLINRCVSRLVDTLPAGIAPIIVDLTRVSSSTKTVPQRMREVCAELTAYLSDRELAEAPVPPPGPDTSLRTVYRRISEALRRLPAVLIVLLPPTGDSVGELAEYADLVQPRIVFFAESSEVEAVKKTLDGMHPTLRDELIVLQVGPLEPEDGWTLVRSRLDRLPPTARTRTVSRETMERATRELEPSVSQMVALLVALWNDPLPDDSPPPEVQRADIFLHFIRLAKESPR
jgi:energy-coupling factor transporter ATP-binding protein EcfA2